MSRKDNEPTNNSEVLGMVLLMVGTMTLCQLGGLTAHTQDLFSAAVRSSADVDVFGPKVLTDLFCLAPLIVVTAFAANRYIKSKK